MFLDSIALIKTLPCLAEPGKIIVIASPSRSLEQVIPYLATLPGILAYNPATCSLTFRRQPGLMTLGPDRVYLTQVKDVEDGLELLAALVGAINATWEGRGSQAPARSAPSGHLASLTADQLQAVRGSYLHGFCSRAATGKP